MDHDSECGLPCVYCGEDCVYASFCCDGDHRCGKHIRMGNERRLAEEIQPYECFVNLTNGLEWLPLLKRLGKRINYVRICSTDMEKNHWEDILLQLDTNLLMRLALGQKCMILDCGANRTPGKVVEKGVPWIKHILEDYWMLNRPFMVAGEPRILLNRKLGYFRRFLATDTVHLYGNDFATFRDGDKEFYRSLALEQK